MAVGVGGKIMSDGASNDCWAPSVGGTTAGSRDVSGPLGRLDFGVAVDVGVGNTTVSCLPVETSPSQHSNT